ncbi:gluconokinase [Lacticaseibacillus parakribbianus]|uniref:gluconokinase n=1 Tax=Lacticaseibacillus parakribbianus TaxID=2970927 RepID=UPI0021CB5028|nr:gluconokinase [Lacticaseibacillus parakribbianus]
MSVIIGVDIGTTSTKVVAFAPDGTVQAQAGGGYPLERPVPGAAEQDPRLILAAVRAGLAQVVAQVGGQNVAAISFSAAMHSLMLLDAAGQPLTAMMTWADNRAAAVAAALAKAATTAARLRQTGVPIHPMSPLAKLIWLNQTRPGLVQQAAQVVGIKAFVLQALCGRLVVDRSLANATGLYDPATGDWAADLLALAGVTRGQLPALCEPTAAVGPLLPAVAESLGLAPATPVIAGSSDGPLSNLGLGAVAPGQYAVTIGTSGAVRVVAPKLALDPAGRLFTYYLGPRQWVIGGPVNNGGNVLQWLNRTLAPQLTLTELTALAATAPAGSHDLLFLPYLAGERAPLWNAAATGSFVGLTTTHTTADLVRAGMEGVIFNLAAVLALLTPLAGPVTTLAAAGGFAKSPLWCQMLADITGCAVTVPASVESSALGAAVLGAQALDRLPLGQALPTAATHRFVPNPEAVAIYRPLAAEFRRLTAALA